MSVIKSGLQIAATVLILMPFTVQAQDMQSMQTKTPQERAQSQTKMLQKRLNLSADQTNAVSSLNMNIANSMDSLMHSSIDKKTVSRARKQMAMDKETKLQSILTQDQYKQYQVLEEERKQRMMQRRQMMQNGDNNQMDNTGNN
ncbi:MAG: hypothetical protein P4L41_01645 [Flavipsychrobacter sp.]|nr:hypothetical protein [Flavipsychrobacter sp.]